MASIGHQTKTEANWGGVRGSQQNERKYYFAGSSRLAMLAPQGCSASLRKNGTLTWLLSDHLGSTSVVADASGNLLSSLRYTAFGEVRAASGTTATDYRYTGQRREDYIKLYWYGSRWYDDALGRFIQPDTLVPDYFNPLDWDRYQYVRSNPIRYTDPSGHMIACSSDSGNGCEGFGPSTIVKAGFDPDKMNEFLRGFMVARPDYRVENDPLIYTKYEEQIVRTAQFQVEAEKPQNWGDWTLQIGFGGMGFFGVDVRGDMSLAVDGKGNIGLLRSLGGGGDTTLGANIGFYITLTNAPSIDKLKGTSVQIGGQIGDGASLSGEFETFRDPDTGKIYSGYTMGGGGQLAFPWPFEFHGTATYTWGNIRYRR